MQLVDADIHSALSVVATELKPGLLQLHHPAAKQFYKTFIPLMMVFARDVYHVFNLCLTTSDVSAPSRKLLSRFWVGSNQHKTPMVLMDLVSARRLPNIMINRGGFGSIILAHVSSSTLWSFQLPEWSKAMEALCRSHAVQQFGVQTLQHMLSGDHYSASTVINCIAWMKYLIHVYRGVLVNC